jgi:peptide/nickel transport system substrate-binding protein
VPSAPFFNGPTKPGPDLGPVPDLAEAWEISDDSLDYVFTFRQDVTWHDGAPFTANDVKYTWEVIAHPDNTTAAQLYNFFSFVEGAPEYHDGLAEEISGVTVPDDYTVAVTLTEPSAPFLTVASNQFIIPQYILGETEVGKILETEYARAPIGTGPFKFEAWDAGVSIIGAAYDEHFAGRPKLDKVVYRMIPGADANTVITGLRSGEFNAASISLDTYDTLQGDPSVRTIIRPGRSNQYIEFNLVKPFFEDVRVRKALSYATNRQEIVDTIWKGRAKVYNSVFPYDWWPTKQDTTIFDNDPEQAAALLDEAGWVVGSDGIREKDGVKFSFIMHSINDDWPLVVQQQWKAVGVEFQHEYVDFPTLSTQYYTTGLFDAVALTIPYGLYTDPHYSLPGYFLSANNRNKYANPKSDELIIAAAATNDQEERQRLYYEWQEVIAQDVPHLWLGNPDTAFAYSANLVTPELASSYFEWREVKDWYYVE